MSRSGRAARSGVRVLAMTMATTVAMVLFGGIATADPDRTFTLLDQAGVFWNDDLERWFEEVVAESTKGAVSLRVLDERTVPGEAVVSGTRSGRYPLATVFARTSGLPLVDIAALPGVLDSVGAYGEAFDSGLEQAFRDVLDSRGLVFLATGAYSGLVLVTTQSLDSLGALAGRRIGSRMPDLSSALTAIGAVPVPITHSPSATSAAMNSGDLDAALINPWTVAALSKEVFTDASVYEWPFGKLRPWLAFADERAWASLESDARNGLATAFEQLQGRLIEEAHANEVGALEALRERGIAWRGFSRQGLKAAQTTGQPFKATWQDWVDRAVAGGVAKDRAEELLRRMREIGVAYSGPSCPDNQTDCSGECRIQC